MHRSLSLVSIARLLDFHSIPNVILDGRIYAAYTDGTPGLMECTNWSAESLGFVLGF